MGWRRRVSLERQFPREYRRWQLTQEEQTEQYVIQDLPPEDDELALDMMVESFMRDEATCKSTNASADPLARSEMRSYWVECVSERLSLACYQLQADGSRRLVGVNICNIAEQGQPEPDVSRLKSVWRQILKTLLVTSNVVDVYASLGVQRYLSASGLVVLPELRGRGLAVELVRARENLCAAVGLVATATVFTGLASQHVATRCGLRVLGEVHYADLRARGWLYPDIDTPSAKLMGRRYDE